MWFFQKNKKRQPNANIFHDEDQVRRALSRGDFSDDNVRTFIELARQRNKPADLVHLSKALEKAGVSGLLDEHELEAARKQQEQRRKAWTCKAGGPLRIAMFHLRAWQAQLAEGVARLAGEEVILRTGDEQELIESRPNVVISSYIPPESLARMRSRLPETFWLYLRHGIVNKRTSFGIAGAFDAVCVSSAYIAESYCNAGFFPREDVWITGYPPLDGLAQRSGPGGADVPTVLYAPTFTDFLSSAQTFGPALIERIMSAKEDLRLIVKLHPETSVMDEETWLQWKRACSNHDQVRFVEDSNTDLLSLFGEVDILISDFSSTAFLFLATGRPIVFLTPKTAKGKHAWYDPDAIEWKWRGMAEEVRKLSRVAPVLRKILGGQDEYTAKREHYRNLLFGDTLDGNSSARVMQKLGEVFGR